jgi:hypothetical protein
MHSGQDDNLMVLQGDRYIDIYETNTKKSCNCLKRKLLLRVPFSICNMPMPTMVNMKVHPILVF